MKAKPINPERTTSGICKYLRNLLALTATYFIAGKWALLLAIPPGFATPVWPSAGIALAGILLGGNRYLPGVLIGSFATNILVASSSSGDITNLTSITVALMIALGATAQAGIGGWLIRKFVQWPNPLEQPKDIFLILILGGAVGCLVNAICGPLTLHGAGFLPAANLAKNSMIWWIGDALGVIAFAPITLLLFYPKESNATISRNRKIITFISLAIMFTIVVCIFLIAQKKDMNARNKIISEKGYEVAFHLQKELEAHINTLLAIERFFASSNYVSFEEFQKFTSKFFELNPGIHGLTWNQKVNNEERSTFEASIRDQGFPDFQIKERIEYGKIEPAPERSIYFPVTYITPYALNHVAHGYDTYSPDAVTNNIRQKILHRAQHEKRAVSTGRISIVQAEDQYGLIIYHPIFNDKQNSNNEYELAGFAAGVFVLPQLMESIAAHGRRLGLDLQLFDISNGQQQLLFDSRTSDFKESQTPIADSAAYLKHHHVFDIAGQKWEIIAIGRAEEFAKENWMLWVVLVGCISFASLFGAFILIITGRADNIQRLVDEKTAALAETNTELEEFSYRTSHDLRSPLISSIGLLEMANESIQENDLDEATHCIDHTRTSLKKLNALVEDILSIAKTKNAEEPEVIIDFNQLLNDSITKFEHMNNYQRLEIIRDFRFTQPLKLKKNRLILILENLISNSIKYQDLHEQASYIKISTYQEDQNFIMEFSDNGLGIPEKHRPALFAMFKRFHPKVSFGSGLGLYMMKKAAEIMNGEIIFAAPAKGVIFKLKIPIE